MSLLLLSCTLNAKDSLKLKSDSIVFPIIYGGIDIPLNINLNSGNANQLGDNLYCCSGVEFSDVSIAPGLGVNFGVIYGILDSLPVLKSVTYGSSAQLSWFNNSYTGKSLEYPRRVYSGNNTITDFYEAGIVNISTDYIKLYVPFNLGSLIDTNSIKYKEIGLQPKYNFGVGPIFGFQISNNAEQFVEIQNNPEYKYLDGSRKKLVISGELTNSNNFIFGFGTNLNFIWNLQQIINKVEIDNIDLSLSLGWDYYLTNMLKSESTTLHQLYFSLGFKWLFKKDIIIID